MTVTFPAMVGAEAGRRTIELRRGLLLVLLANATMAVFSIWLESSVVGGWLGRSGGAPAVLCWITVLSIAGVMSGDVAAARRDGTLLHALNQDFYKSMVKNGYARAIAECVISLPPALICIGLASYVFGALPSLTGAIFAILGGMIAGIAIVPLTFAIALYAKGGGWISLLITMLTFAWIGAGSAGAGGIALYNPAGLERAIATSQGAVWMGFWLVTAMVAFGAALLLLRLVRASRDLLIDG